MDEPDEKPDQKKGKYTKESASVAGFTAPRDWEKFVTGVMGPKTLLTGVCLLPIMPDWPADNRRSAMCVPLTRRTATRIATHPPHRHAHRHPHRQPHRCVVMQAMYDDLTKRMEA